MTKPNTTVANNEALYFIDYTDLFLYRNKYNKTLPALHYNEIPNTEKDKYEYAEDLSQTAMDDFKSLFCSDMTKHFPSLSSADIWLGRKQTHVILENKVIQIGLEDNEWGLAVKVLRKDDGQTGIQTLTFESFDKGTKEYLLKQFSKIFVRTGPYSKREIVRPVPIIPTSVLNAANVSVTPPASDDKKNESDITDPSIKEVQVA